MPALEGAIIYGVQIRESANDGSDFSNAAADYRILFLGEDGLLHVKDSSGTVTGPYTGGSAGYVLLEQHTASSSATLDFTSFISSTYDEYEFQFIGIVPATDNAMFLVRAGTGGGPTYDTGSNYPYSNFWKQVGTTAAVASWGTTATAISLFNDSAGGGLSNVAGTSLNGSMKLFDPQTTARPKMMTWEQIFNYYSDDTYYRVSGGGNYNQTTALTAVRFLMSTGNIASGTIRVYGIAK